MLLTPEKMQLLGNTEKKLKITMVKMLLVYK